MATQEREVPETLTAEAATFPFMELPPEIRDDIYHILLVRHEPIHISSPQTRTFADLASSSGTSSILYTNRKIHYEAIRVFYTFNTFVVGNGQHLSKTEANAHAFRTFTTSVPRPLLASIRNLNIVIGLHLISTVWAQFRALVASEDNIDHNSILGLGTASHASDVRQICRSLSKHFPGLRSVRIDWTYCPLGKSSSIYQLSRPATVSSLTNCIRKLMQLPEVRQLCISNHLLAGIEDIAEQVVKEESAGGREAEMKVIPAESFGRSNYGEIHLSW